jgi:hypothetical protein
MGVHIRRICATAGLVVFLVVSLGCPAGFAVPRFMETSIFVTDLAQQFSLSVVGPLTLLSSLSGRPEQVVSSPSAQRVRRMTDG